MRILQRSLTVKVGAENLYTVYGINMARGAVKTRKRTLNGRRRDLASYAWRFTPLEIRFLFVPLSDLVSVLPLSHLACTGCFA